MKLRLPKDDEFEKLLDLHQKEMANEFPFPDLRFVNRMYVVVDGDTILGFGILRPIFEAIVILNKDKSRSERVKVLTMLIEKCESELKSQNIDGYHGFVQDKGFFNFLKKRFGFKESKGAALVKNLYGKG